MATVIGIDLGGTAIKLGVFKANGNCVENITLDTPQPATPTAVLDSIAEVCLALKKKYQVQAMGLGTPGPVDIQGRIAKVAINLSGWDNVPVADILEAKTGIRTILENDANCAGLGEAWLGAGKEFDNLILLTLGTGVGGAIIINKKLFRGSLGSAGELGLITYDPSDNAYPCNSGNKGSLEQYLSISAIKRMTGKEPIDLGELAQKGDEKALKFWQDYGKILGIGLTSLIYILAPSAVIISGGISASSQYFLPSAIQEIEQRVLATSREGLRVMVSTLGNQAGMIGSANLAWQLLRCTE